jgi:hypothetical protein
VHRRLFSTYLSERDAGDPHQIKEAARLVSASARRMGRLARDLGWISPRKLRKILCEQRLSHRCFGAIAQSYCYLTQDQIYCLLALQREQPEELAESLVQRGVLLQEESQQQLKTYYARVRAQQFVEMRS